MNFNNNPPLLKDKSTNKPKTVEELRREIIAGKLRKECKVEVENDEVMPLEGFIDRATANEDETNGVFAVKAEIYEFDDQGVSPMADIGRKGKRDRGSGGVTSNSESSARSRDREKMAYKVKNGADIFICRNKERANPITMCDRRHAEHFRAGDQLEHEHARQSQSQSQSQSPTVADPSTESHGIQPEPQAQPQSSRFTIRCGGVSIGSRSTHTPSLGTDVDGDDESALETGFSNHMETDAVIKRDKKGRFVSQSQVDVSASGARKKGKRNDESWVIREPCPGGPIDPRVIPSFGGHVARSIWDNPSTARGSIVCYNRPSKVAELGKIQLPRNVRTSVVESGLSHLNECTFDHLNMNLISAFVERWQPDTNTFHMPFGEITILLHDVQYLLGLSIEGSACGPPVVYGKPHRPLVDVCTLMGMVEEDLTGSYRGGATFYKNGGVLAEAVKDVVLIGDDDDMTKAYLALLVGSTLFLDKSSDRIRSHVFSILSQLDEIKSYAWGVGTLAYLYRQLGQASRAGAKGIAGCLPLLEAWIYTYFPTFRPGAPSPLRPAEPGVMGWRGGPKHSADGSVLSALRERIDALTPHSVRWVPHTHLDIAHSSSLFCGCIQFMEIVEPYQPDRCLRQFGYVQTIPRSMPKGNFYRPSNGIRYKVEFGSYVNHLWENRADHRVRLDDHSVPSMTFAETTDDYWEWYQRISHRFIYDPAQREQVVVNDDLGASSQLATTLAHIVAPLVDMTSAHDVMDYIHTHRRQIGELCGLLVGRGGGGCRSLETKSVD